MDLDPQNQTDLTGIGSDSASLFVKLPTSNKLYRYTGAGEKRKNKTNKILIVQ